MSWQEGILPLDNSLQTSCGKACTNRDNVLRNQFLCKIFLNISFINLLF